MRRTGKRRGQRIRTHLKALFSAGSGSGEAILAEISYSGARLTGTDQRPELDSSVNIFVWLENQQEPFELTGRVASHRDDGFAIEYEKPGQDTCQMVDLAAAAVAAEEASREQPEPEQQPAAPPVVRKPKPPPLADLDLDAYELPELEAHSSRVAEAIAARRRAMKERLTGR